MIHIGIVKFFKKWRKGRSDAVHVVKYFYRQVGIKVANLIENGVMPMILVSTPRKDRKWLIMKS